MTTHLSRIAAAVLVALTAVAVVDVSRSLAQAVPSAGPDVISTTCGAGTKDQCATTAVTKCDWELSFSLNPQLKGVEIHIKKVNCSVTGHVPIYKDNDRDSYALSGSCDLLAPFLGLPAGAGCS